MRLLLPPPVVVGIGLLLLYAGARLFPALNLTFSGQTSIAAVFLIAGLAIGGHALFRFVMAGTTFNPITPDKARTLVTQGFYRVSRNPMYVADVLLLLAFGSAPPPPLDVVPLLLALALRSHRKHCGPWIGCWM